MDSKKRTEIVVKAPQAAQVSVKPGSIEIRHEGRPIAGQLGGSGSVYLVIDCSSSMSGTKLTQAKQGAAAFARQAWGKRYSVGLIQFASSAEHICEPQKEGANLRGYLEKLIANGSTNMAEGIELATLHLTKLPHKPKALVLVTDGQPDSCEEAIKAAQKAKERQIDIIAIGTDDADQSLLRTLASRTELALEVVASQLNEGIASAARMLPGAQTTGNPS